MATTAQIEKLRRKIQDYYDARTGAVLTTTDWAFQDNELEDIIDDAAAEVTDGASVAADLSALQESRMILVARADAMLQIAGDEARRIRWQTGNKIQDPTQVAPNLVRIAEALQKRYEDARKRELQEEIAGIGSRPIGGNLRFNSTVKNHCERDFNNRTVQRNRSPDH